MDFSKARLKVTSILGFLAFHLETRFKPEVVAQMLTRGAAIDLKRETDVLESTSHPPSGFPGCLTNHLAAKTKDNQVQNGVICRPCNAHGF